MNEVSIIDIPIYDFVDISKMNLEEAIKALEKVDYGIITDESNNKCLVTAKVLSDLHKKIDLDNNKKNLWDLRKELPPTIIVTILRKELPSTVIVTISSKEGINENYHSVEVDTSTIKVGAIGAIVIIDEKVEGIIALEDLPHVRDLGEVSSKKLTLGMPDVNSSIVCEICNGKVFYHQYSSMNPPKCLRCGWQVGS